LDDERLGAGTLPMIAAQPMTMTVADSAKVKREPLGEGR